MKHPQRTPGVTIRGENLRPCCQERIPKQPPLATRLPTTDSRPARLAATRSGARSFDCSPYSTTPKQGTPAAANKFAPSSVAARSLRLILNCPKSVRRRANCSISLGRFSKRNGMIQARGPAPGPAQVHAGNPRRQAQDGAKAVRGPRQQISAHMAKPRPQMLTLRPERTRHR